MVTGHTEKFALQEEGVKTAVAPLGRPDGEKVISSLLAPKAMDAEKATELLAPVGTVTTGLEDDAR